MTPTTRIFAGCGTALVTPFLPSGAVDEAAFRRLLAFQIDGGIDFLVPCGTTGETPTLSRAEHLHLVSLAVEAARRAGRRVPVLGGAGGNNTQAVAELAREVEQCGVDGVLTVAPYYNKPTQEGLYRHFATVAEAITVPMIVYNVPGRTSSNIEAETTLRLAKIGNIAGIKEASGNLTQIGAILAAAQEDFLVLSGDDALTLPMLALGAQGLVSVASNEIPAAMTELVRLGRAGDFTAARRLHFRYLELMEVNFVESSPGPVKAALARMGLIQEFYRLPMVPIRDASRRRLEAALERVGLLGASAGEGRGAA